MPLTKATTNVIDLDKDTLINGVTVGQGAFQDQSNTALGNDALGSSTAGTNNTAVGYLALQVNGGLNNTAVGQSALIANTTGDNNTAVGAGALDSNTTGIQNTAVGRFALKSNTIADNNTAFGYAALDSNTTGDSNTAVGFGVLASNSTGINNTALGYNSGATNTTGSSNVFIGASSAGSAANVSNQVNIYNGSVIARFTGAASAWSFVSDERDKKNIEDLTIGLDFINQLKARKFAWDMRNSHVDKDKEASGFIAQEVLQVVNANNAEYTGLVDASNSEQYTFAMSNLIPILVKAVQELSAKVAELEAK